jgi:hypothetical protein
MTINRRNFLRFGTLIACGTAVGGTSLLAASSAIIKGGIPMVEGDASVLAFVKGYSSNVRIIGASVLGRIRTSGLRTLHIIAEVNDLDRMASILIRAPFSGIYTEGNTFNFALSDVDVTIENLLPEVFASRLAAMGKRAGNAFAHDALSYNPETKEISDPFSARSSTLKIVNKTFGGPAALAVALRGRLESAQLGIAQGEDFALWKNRVLRAIARSADARKLSENFLQQLATLADKLPPGGVEALLRTRLISTALKQVFQINVAEAVAAFKRLRKASGPETPDSAIWLAVLIGPEIESNAADGAATTWLQRGPRFQVMRSKRALAKAAAILQV